MSPKVSVLVLTYNQAPYIRAALDSVLCQVTDFELEVVVGDDHSTDGTAEIVRAYADRHPGLIVPHLHDRNLGGRGVGNYLFLTSVARGEYVALLEGDDLFTDPAKLQLQAAFLDANPDCAGCFHDCSLIDPLGRELQALHPTKLRQPRVSQAEIIAVGNNAITNTRMFRRACLEDPPGWYLAHTMDWGIEILVAGHGSWGFIERTMSAYRIHGEGIFSGASLPQRHGLLLAMTRVLLDEPTFAVHRRALRGRLAWMNRDLADWHRRRRLWPRYLLHLARYVRYSDKNAVLLKSLIRQDLLGGASHDTRDTH